MKITNLHLLSPSTLICALVVQLAAVVLAVPPSNDNFADATVVASLPYTDVIDLTEATTELNEPQYCGLAGESIWYAITLGDDTVVRVDPSLSSFIDTVVTVYRPNGPGFDLNFLGCGNFHSPVTFLAKGGITYYIQAGNIFGGGGLLNLNIEVIPPPPNDDFAAAKVIHSLPFDDLVETTAATLESGEPQPSCYPGIGGSVWYAFTAQTSGSVSAYAGGPFVVAVYTGDSLEALDLVTCGPYYGLAFHVEAGATYHIQVANQFGQPPQLNFRLDITPPPIASFYFYPPDPSVFDNIQFQNASYDPAGVGFESVLWDFGDGSTSVEWSPIHHYAVDGEYLVELSVTTLDGRSDSVSQTVLVRTHDVAITKFMTPQSANSGQTRSITVGISSRLYAENVEVRLSKGTPGGGEQLIGTLTQFVPIRGGNRTTDFDFSYTFTAGDAQIGKVTFRAVAFIPNGRDALPADNEAISSPVRIGH